MAKNQLSFFGTRGDLESYLGLLSKDRLFHFALAGLFDDENPRIIEDLRHEPNWGLARSGKSVMEPHYLLFDPKTTQVKVRAVPQKAGGTKFAVDQVENPATLVLQLGGRFDENILVAGQIGTASEDPVSVAIYKKAAKVMRSQFIRIQSYLVGREAASLLDNGWRLTSNAKASGAYDLKR